MRVTVEAADETSATLVISLSMIMVVDMVAGAVEGATASAAPMAAAA